MGGRVLSSYTWTYRPIHTYLIFVIFLHRQNFWRIKFTQKKRVNYDKIHSKLPIFLRYYGKIHSKLPNSCVKSKKITPAKKKLHKYIRGVRDKYEVCTIYGNSR